MTSASVWTVTYSHDFKLDNLGLVRLEVQLAALRHRLVCRPFPGVSLYTRNRLRPWARVATNRRTGQRTLTAGLLYFAVCVSLPAIRKIT